MHYKLNLLLLAELDRREFPLVLDAAATKAACEHDFLLIGKQMGQPEVVTSPSKFSALYRQRRFCEEVLAAANHAIGENHRLEIFAETMARLLATFIVQEKEPVNEPGTGSLP